MKELYPLHYKALETAELTPKVSPTLKQMKIKLKNALMKKKESEAKNARRRNSRQVYFCVGVNQVFRGKKSIHLTLKRLRNKYNFKWLRCSMSYHKFPNLGELFGGDLSGNIMKDVMSDDFMHRPCNCNIYIYIYLFLWFTFFHCVEVKREG